MGPPRAGGLLARLSRRALPRLLRLQYDLKALWSPHLTVLNCGYSPGQPLPAWALQELARHGEEADPAGVALYLRLAALAGPRGRGPEGEAPCGVAPPAGAWAGLRVLEVGCGLGGGARSLAALLRPEAWHAMDSSGRSIAACWRWHARLLLPLPVTYVVQDATLLGRALELGAFDLALLVQSAHAVVDSRGLCEGLAHALRPGGLLLLADHLRPRRWGGLQARLGEAGLRHEWSEDIAPQLAHGDRLTPDMGYLLARFRRVGGPG